MSLNYVAALKKEKNTAVSVVTTPDSAKAQVPQPEPEQIVVPVTEPSICIPHLPSSFNDGQILEIINEIGLGEITKIDLINKTDRNGRDYLMAFIHFASWRMEGQAKIVHEGLMNDENITVYYDDPKYLVLSKSYSPRHGTGEFRKKAVKNRKRTPAKTSYLDNNGETWFTKTAKKVRGENITQTRTPSPSCQAKRSKMRGFSGLDIDSSDEDE